MGEGFALTRKYGVKPETFYGVLTEGLFACWAYKTYGKFIAEETEKYAKVIKFAGIKPE